MGESTDLVITSLLELYTSIICLPYIAPDALVLPPLDGWSGVDADELRKRGKTDEVIELLRRLPYLRNPDSHEKWMLSPDTLAIAYCDGEIYPASMDEMQPTPAHCIWLTVHDSRNGTDLLLDVHAGSITEWSMIERGLIMDYAEYEKIDKAYRWMCYPTMPVVEFFKLWRARWEKLVWIPVQNPRRGPASALWWYRAIPGSDEEQYILSSDTEYEPTNDVDDEDSNSDSDAESNDDFSGGGDVENSEDMILSDNELDDILEDAFGKEAQKKRQEFTSDFARSTDDSLSAPSSEPDTHVTTKSDPEEQEADIVYAIFKRNGWPTIFNRNQCKVELDEFQGTRRR